MTLLTCMDDAILPRKKSTAPTILSVVLLCAAGLAGPAQAQQAPPNFRPDPPAKTPPSTDALDTAHTSDPDRAAESSPVPAEVHGSTLRLGTRLIVTLSQALDSGHARNGDTVFGSLAAPVRTTSGATLPAGTRVAATVVSAARAGTVNAAGILSLQLTAVGAIPIISDVRDFDGKEGHKDVADSAPEKGSEATIASGTTLEFRVLEQGPATGLVPGVAPANIPAAAQGAGQQTKPTPANASPGASQQSRIGVAPNLQPAPSKPAEPHL